MAYKFSRGEREFGDIEFEGDAGTGIDFEDDQVSLETGGAQRLLVNNYGAIITGSLEITGSIINKASHTGCRQSQRNCFS